ncbi:hypothetical protein DVA67_012790 [Solirubrobacter sp. CPCC 204708]|uniref:Uncharacterized protein n=1 Tax=Solirubrobacter deserti TaxID=2282478 RepID=A0ABT4RK72_9ACTN|nr:hypothetical protein [Solirubrobacter deserti]MBE2316852.1 hypothetical protein [Solirubrobacter deserti]MDA0138931.1 hypothetical protein [Solirubrobacter deserti]
MLRAALLTLLILVVLPASASAACRTAPAANVWYDSPVLQVWADGEGWASCVRPTNTEHVYRDRGDGPEARLDFGHVWGDRWITLVREKGYDSDDSSIEYLGSDTYDALTGQPATGRWGVDAGPQGIVLRHGDGRTEVIDPTPVSEELELVFQGRRLYWLTPSGPRTALLNVPDEPAPPRAKPLRARKMTNCTPRTGANLLVRYRRIVVTRKGKSVHACFNKRVTPIGDAREFQHLGGAAIAYTRPGFAGYLDANHGPHHELPSAGGPIAATFSLLAAVDRRGVLRAWAEDRKRPVVLTRGGASDVVATHYEVFWMAPDRTPRVRKVS